MTSPWPMPLVAGVPIFALLGASAALLPWPLPLAPVALLAGALAGLVVGRRALQLGLLAAATAVMPANGLVVAGFLTVSDGFLLGAAALVVLPDGAGRADAGMRSWTEVLVRPALAGLTLLAAGGLLALTVTEAPDVHLAGLARLLGAALVVVVVLRVAPTPRELLGLLAAFVLGAAASALAGLTVATNPVTGRALGLAFHPNQLAVISVMAAGLGVGLAGAGGRLRRLLAAATLLCAGGAVASGSRSGLAALGVVATFALLRTLRGRPAVGVAVGATLLAALVWIGVPDLGDVSVVPGFDRVGESDAALARSDELRVELLERYADRAAANPLLGAGFADDEGAHNVYLQVWSALGLTGSVGFAVVVAGTVARSWGASRRRGDALLRALGLGLLLGFLGYLAGALFQNALFHRHVWLFVAAAAALPTPRGATSEGA